jgi:hypothetical protein
MTPGRQTEDVILDLAHRPVPSPFAPAAIIAGMMAMIALGLWLFLGVFGLRTDLFDALQSIAVQAKSILPLVLFVIAMRLAIASAQPGLRAPVWPLALPVAAGGLLVLHRLTTMGSAPVGAEMLGQSALACLTSILLLSALPLATGLLLMRRGAPTRPGVSGALVGLAAGAGVTAGYALYCTEDSPLFFVLWYGLAMSLPMGIGAALGPRVLRW